MGRKKRATKQPGTTTSRPAAGINLSRNVIILILLGVTFLAFANSLRNDFAYDDDTQVLHNEFIRSFSNIPQALVTESWFWRAKQDRDPNKENKPSTPYYRPVFTVYLMVGWKLFQDSPVGWHFLSIVLHLLIVYLAFLIMEQVTGDRILAGIAALLFAVHPLRSESVAWISGATDLLLSLFFLLSFHFYLKFRKSHATKDLVIACVTFLIASFTKEPAIALPILVVAYEFFVQEGPETLKERIIQTAKAAVPFLIISVFYFGMRFYSLGFMLSDKNYTNYPTFGVLLTIPIVICKYLYLLFCPFNLSIYHYTPLVESPIDVRFILPVLFLAAVGFLLWKAWPVRAVRFGALWFLVNMMPALNLYAFEIHFMVQERYLYLASVGFSLLIATGLIAIFKRLKADAPVRTSSVRPALITAVVVLCLVLTAKTMAQNPVWKDDMTLYIHGSEVASDQSMPHFILGHQYLKRQNWDGVVSELEQCVKINPESIVSATNLAAAHLLLFERTKDQGHVYRALDLCQSALNDIKNDTDVQTITTIWDTMGHAYDYDTGARDYNKALSCFGAGLKVDPGNSIINAHLGATLIKLGKFNESLPYLKTAVAVSPDVPDTYKFLAYAYTNLGQYQDAANNLTKYLTLQPNAIDAEQERRQLQMLQAKLQTPK